MNAAVAAQMASLKQQMDQMHQALVNSKSNRVKKRKFEQPNFPLETMEDFGDLEDKLRDHRFQRFMVSSSFPSLLLELITFLYLLDRLLGAERKH